MRSYFKEFNDLEKSKEINENSLEFSLSILHARISFLETILHMAYKLSAKKWQIKSQEDKEIVKNQKKKQVPIFIHMW